MSEQNELRRLAEAVNARSEEIGEFTWYYKEQFRLSAGSIHDSEQEYLAALDPAAILKLLDHIESLERSIADERKTDEPALTEKFVEDLMLDISDAQDGLSRAYRKLRDRDELPPARKTDEQINLEGMAQSMDMFRNDMIEAGVIGDNVPPMFMTEAILGYIGKLRSGKLTDEQIRDAAPDMLAALKLVIEEKAPSYHDCTDNGEPECAWCIAREAIAKATAIRALMGKEGKS